MAKESLMKNKQVLGIAIPAVILVVMFVGVCVVNKTECLPDRPLVAMLKQKADEAQAVEDAKPKGLYVGQPEEEVLELLGEPGGRMAIKGQNVWLYEGEMLYFADGALITSNETTFATVMQAHQKKVDQQAEKKGSLLDKF